MLTYQNLLEVAENDDKARMDFIRKAIAEHKGSELYRIANDAEQYRRHKNVTINKYRKILYTVTGKAVPDNWSANFKMASRFFHRFITQESQYLLGNGVTWGKNETKKKLGNNKYPFDTQLQEIGKNALVHGVSFGFFNLDHVESFSLLEFVPLYDEEDGSLKAGIRFWQIDDQKPLRATLYELDGYTDYIWRKGKEEKNNGEVLNNKRSYKVILRGTDAEGTTIFDGENYPNFPIVPLWGNPEHQSELVGIREQIDCYDLIKSGFANTVDEASIVYWTLTNAGGMDDIDLAKFIERMKTVHAVKVDDEIDVTPHTLDAPSESREVLLKRLEDDLYKDAMALNTGNLASGSYSTTATQILAAYEPLDAKTDDFEYCINSFLKSLLELAGIEDEFSFTRSKIINKSEEIQAVIQAASFLDSQYVAEKLLTIMGDGDRVQEVLANIEKDDMARFGVE